MGITNREFVVVLIIILWLVLMVLACGDPTPEPILAGL